MKKEVVILHDFDGKIYFSFLEEFYQVRYYVLKPLRSIIVGLLKFNRRKIAQGLLSLTFLISSLLFRRDRTVLFASAPGQSTILWIYFLRNFDKIYYHTSWPYYSDNLFYKQSTLFRRIWADALLNFFSEIVVVTEEAKHNLLQNLDLNSIVIGHAMRLDRGVNTNTNLDKIRLIFVGRLVKEKGIGVINNLSMQLDSNRYEISIAGARTDYCNSFHWPENVRFLGWLDKKDIQHQLSLSHFLLQPSQANKDWEELFGLSILEAMAYGVVPVATNHLGPRSLLSGVVCGFCYNEEEFLDKTVQLLKEITFNQWKEISRQAQMVSDKYSVSNVLREWGRLLDY